jgi:hypothetical protein
MKLISVEEQWPGDQQSNEKKSKDAISFMKQSAVQSTTTPTVIQKG